MASAAITITGGAPATIESDSTGNVITCLNASRGGCVGRLYNLGSADVWARVELDDTAGAASDVATTGAQAQLQVPIPADGWLDILTHYRSVAHKTAAGTAVLVWQPQHSGSKP